MDTHIEQTASFWRSDVFTIPLIRKRALNLAQVLTVHIKKINDVYRKVIYVKTADYHDLVVLKDRTEKYIEINSGFDKMRIQFDFNPM